MTLNKQQLDQMFEAARPLKEWLGANCHPHCTALVESDRIILVEGIAGGPFPEDEEDSACPECGGKLSNESVEAGMNGRAYRQATCFECGRVVRNFGEGWEVRS